MPTHKQAVCGECGAPILDLAEGRGSAVWIHNTGQRGNDQRKDLDHQPTLGRRVVTLPPVAPGDVLPVGQLEIGQRLGVPRETVEKWRQRVYLHFPPPRWTVGGNPCWQWSTVSEWAINSGRGDHLLDEINSGSLSEGQTPAGYGQGPPDQTGTD